MSEPCTPTTLESADGARLTCCDHGGHVLGWVPAGSDVDRLWMSPLAACGPGRAIRGGVPVIFPQFSGRGPLPKHGFARDRAWEVLTPQHSVEGSATWSARLRDDADTRAIWPHAFSADLLAVASGTTLRITLGVANDDPEPFGFAAALHSYLALGGGPGTTVTGLGGRIAEDNTAGGAPMELPLDPLSATDAIDAAVRGVDGPVRVNDTLYGPLVLDAEGFPDRVMWNPGPDHGLADVPAGGEAGFVCVEPAQLTTTRLAPGERWSATLILTVPAA